MAYNPFNVFRRNQKAIFSVLVVFIMFMFVLSSGLGGGADFFEWLPQWLGAKTKKGDHLATIDGTKIYSGDLDALYRQRLLANRFMSLASEVTLDQLTNAVRNLQPRMSQRGKDALDRLNSAQMMMAQFGRNPQLLGFVMDSYEKALRELRVLSEAPQNPEDREVANYSILQMELLRRRQAGGSELYFTNSPNQTQRDRIEFMLWERKADQLGITFTQADVKALIQKEFMGQFVSDAAVRGALKGSQGGFSMEACLRALASEFKVRAAQTAVLGPVSDRADRTLTAFPAFVPPFEQFQYFRENASPTTYHILSVPAGLFVGDVREEPKEEELQALYRQFQGQEPNPASEQPGFKQPRQIKVEWLSARGDEPYFKQAAAERLGKGQVANVLGMAFGSPLAAAGAAPLLTSEPLLDKDYKDLTETRHRQTMVANWSFPLVNIQLLETSVVRPEVLAGAAGAAAGAIGSFGFNMAAAHALGDRAWAAEQRARVLAGVPALLGAVPGPGMFATMMAGEVRVRVSMPKPLPVDVVRPRLKQEQADREARKVMNEEMTKLKTDLSKPEMLKARDKGDAIKMINEFVAKRGLPTGKSADGEAGFKDEWTIGDDPGLAPLKAALEKSEGGNNPHRAVAAPIQFGRAFFWAEGEPGGRAATRDLYKPDFYPAQRFDPQDVSPAAPEPRFLVWRTADRPATTLAYPVARPQVLAAWKRAKARELAKARAEDIRSLVEKSTQPNETAIKQDLELQRKALEAKTTDPKLMEAVRVFELGGVSPMAPADGLALGGQPGVVQPFRMPPTKTIMYPTQDMMRTLLDERAKPVKTAVVLTDAPKDTYYVAVVGYRAEKSEPAFRSDVFSESQIAAARQLVTQGFTIDAQRKAYASIMAIMKKEFKYVEDDKQKEKLDENARKGRDS